MLGRMIRRAWLAPFAVLIVAGLGTAGWFAEGGAPQITGYAWVIDGDSLKVAGTEIRIYGIDAPEYRQTCLRGGHPWACGIDATHAMRAMIRGRRVACRAREQDRYGRTVAVCTVGGLDLGAAMVKNGHAVAYGAYAADEREARDARRGIWSSSFERPAAWRAKHPRNPR